MDQTKKNLLLFPIGTIGRDMEYALVSNFLLTYILFTRTLTASQLAAITGIMIAARIFDGLNDPIMGNIVERTRSKWGKFKPWLTCGVLLTSVVIYLAFNSDLEGWPFILFFGVIYFAFSIAYTMHDISYWGMIPALSRDANTRNQFTSRATLCAGIGATLANMLIPMLTTGSLAIGGSAKIAYGRIALIIALISPAFLAITIAGVKEDRSDLKKAAPPVSLKKVIGTIKGNDQLVWCAILLLLQQIGNGIVLSGIGSTYIYFEFGYFGGLYSIFSTVGMMASAVLMVFYPALSRHIPRRMQVKLMLLVSALGYVITALSGFLMETSRAKFALVTAGYMLSNFGQYGLYLIIMISIMNTVEYNEFKHGTRDEGIISSLRPFITKLASAITVAIASGSYIIFGITNFTNSISDFENAATRGAITEAEKLSGISDLLAGATSGESTSLLFTMTLLPFIFILSSVYIYLRKYNLDEETYERICLEIELRKKNSR